ncbi:D-alanyl-D-alanine carboxypeptidase family protein [Acaricomes phytoseiuli]|uniref:D-alanyl-D-alanine carboxypeptidase family protein n=1 Tax=Acaricomes phytoseiuli TaxID=291968 RepID=UPI00222318C2|nr:D-alanyl-D-alanine carboxypeptidase family protein [Acaricomes phytoseiuli]MCW1249981.1 D-alanyl-D-alanine carboxypeptidase family protein [Acaricomes phytoseiuli]
MNDDPESFFSRAEALAARRSTSRTSLLHRRKITALALGAILIASLFAIVLAFIPFTPAPSNPVTQPTVSPAEPTVTETAESDPTPSPKTSEHPGVAAIGAVVQQTGMSDPLGGARGEVTCGLHRDGCYQAFQNGSVYWSPSTGAHPVTGGTFDLWAQAHHENGPLDYPNSSENCASGRCEQNFLGGLITRTETEGGWITYTTAVINKQQPLLPLDYAPRSTSSVGAATLWSPAADAAREMTAGAASAGIPLKTISGYRPYATQTTLYNGYVSQYGQAQADRISARPGYSEHQTGLALDVGAVSGECDLQQCFRDTPGGRWIAENSWRYGFIIRYPEGHSEVTGYSYEPWHVRFVGREVASDMHERSVPTLEQYYGFPAAPGY